VGGRATAKDFFIHKARETFSWDSKKNALVPAEMLPAIPQSQLALEAITRDLDAAIAKAAGDPHLNPEGRHAAITKAREAFMRRECRSLRRSY
jgi:hypothetical protein